MSPLKRIRMTKRKLPTLQVAEPFANPRLPTNDELEIFKKAYRLTNKDVLAIDERSDPYWVMEGQEANGIWANEVWKRVNPDNEKIHIRNLHYRFISLPESERRCFNGTVYENNKKCHGLLEDGIKYARVMDLLDPAYLIDRYNTPIRHNTPTEDYDKIDREEHPAWSNDLYPEFRVDSGIHWTEPDISITTDDDFDIPNACFESYHYRYSKFDQPFRLIVFIEKSTMDNELIPICREYNADFVSGKGYTSITLLYSILKRMSNECGNKPARIFYISDYDTSGQNMPMQAAVNLQIFSAKHFPDLDLKLNPIALLEEQCYYFDDEGNKCQIPKAPDKEQIELDALEVYAPGKLAEILENHLLNYYDREQEASLLAAGEQAEERFREAWESETSELQSQLNDIKGSINTIRNTYQGRVSELETAIEEAVKPIREGIYSLNREMEEEIEPYEEELSNLEEEVKNVEPEVDWPDLPVSELEPPDESDWFFDCQRTFREQMMHYNEYKRKSIKHKGKGKKKRKK